MYRLTSTLPAYACHMTWTGHVIRIQQWRNRVFHRSFHQKKTTIYYSTPIFNWQEEIQQLVCWP